VTSAVVVVQVRVDAFGAAPLAIPNGFGGRKLEFFTASRVVVGDGDMPQAFGHLADFFGIVGGVGQIVENIILKRAVDGNHGLGACFRHFGLFRRQLDPIFRVTHPGS